MRYDCVPAEKHGFLPVLAMMIVALFSQHHVVTTHNLFNLAGTIQLRAM